ncbi:MAG: N-acyl-D-amino-acid deacylase [Cellvibrionaceae bacterium]|jgi:N-acyl-D-amino-acid deacylase
MNLYDVIIRNGTVYDGLGGDPFVADVALTGDTIAEIGPNLAGMADLEIDAAGLAVAPGFINMLSWAVESLLHDGRSQSDIRQGVTLEVMGEAFSFGPITDEMAAKEGGLMGNNHDYYYDVPWRSLREYLDHLVERGVSCNVTSFIGTHTLRRYVMGADDRPPTAEELEKMCQLVRQAMAEGAVGMSAALVYPPAAFAKTDELIALCKVVAEFDGVYISHLRSEGDSFLEALDEFLTILREANVRGEIYHLKAAGHTNWHKMDEAIKKIEAAQAEGLDVTADMYLYPAGGTGLKSIVPLWAHDGGNEALIKRLKHPVTRGQIKQEMDVVSKDWENFWAATRSPADILISQIVDPDLKHLIGKSIQEIADLRGTTPKDAALDLLIEDNCGTMAIYFMMSEENIEKQIKLPWVSFDSDAGSVAPEGAFLKSNPHPRTYGNFARLLGKYVRDRQVIPLQEAVRKLTSFPAAVLKLKDRGQLAAGFKGDVVVFDPETIADHATFAYTHQYATGVRDVFVNGTIVLQDGEHTDARPGQVVVLGQS